MPEQNINPTPIVEGSNRFRHPYLFAGVMLLFVSVGVPTSAPFKDYYPLQRYYFNRYV